MNNQRTATVNTLINVTGYDTHIDGQFNETSLQSIITADQKQKVKSILFEMFKNRQVQYRPEFQAKVDDDAELRSYIGGLVNNWLRKAPELNSGQKYVPKNPGSRAGSHNPEVRELKKLLKKVAGTEHEARVKAALDAKIAEVAPAKTVSINADLIPEEFKDLLS